jgi:hypothetical protein
MFRDDISGYEEPPRPPRTTTPWVPVVLVALVALGLAHVTGLTKPVASLALQLAGYGRTPGSRLIGDWESIDDPMFRRVCHLTPQEGYAGTGIYMADRGRGMEVVIFKITSEDRSGRHVEMAEYLPEKEANYKVRYSIAQDGRSMTREYEGPSGIPLACQYRYVGPPTEDPPRSFRPE